MYLVTSFIHLMQPLAAAMSTPSFNNFTTLVTGWVFAPRRRHAGPGPTAGRASVASAWIAPIRCCNVVLNRRN